MSSSYLIEGATVADDDLTVDHILRSVRRCPHCRQPLVAEPGGAVSCGCPDESLWGWGPESQPECDPED